MYEEEEDYFSEDEDDDEDEDEDDLDEEEGEYIEKLSGSFDNSTGVCFGYDDFPVAVERKKDKSAKK